MEMKNWYRESSLKEDISLLGNENTQDRNFINILVMNIILKYLATYLGVFLTNVDEVKSKVEKVMNYNYNSRPEFNLQLMSGIPISSDLFAIDCLSDLQSSAAIFKEIALNTGYSLGSSFTGIDFGSGTGILSLAMYISSMRRGINNGRLILVDNVQKAVDNSRIILSDILGEGFIIDGRKGNLTDTNFFRSLGLDPKVINYIVSETISCTTPAFSIDTETGEIIFESERHIRENELNRFLDPYPTILSYLIIHYPELYNKISSGVAMFPNPRNKQIIPDFDETRVRLYTGLNPREYLPLHRLGDEFSGFEGLNHKGPKRWDDPKEIRDMFSVLSSSI